MEIQLDGSLSILVIIVNAINTQADRAGQGCETRVSPLTDLV